MSQLVDITAVCPQCGTSYSAKLFRTIWGEVEGNRTKVMEDRINIIECPHCHHKYHAPLAMMYVDVVKKFAVWWEPIHDPGIDELAYSFSAMLGPGNFYETAPRVKDWEDFKETINKYYRGELKGQSEAVTQRQQRTMGRSILCHQKDRERETPRIKFGCLSVIIFSIVIASAVTYGVLSFI